MKALRKGKKQGSVSMARRAMSKMEYRMIQRTFRLQSPPSKNLEII
jgi:hypothetical protein